jgi:hypothetical protein
MLWIHLYQPGLFYYEGVHGIVFRARGNSHSYSLFVEYRGFA